MSEPVNDVDAAIDAARPRGSNGGQDPRALDAPVRVPDAQALRVAGALPLPGGSDAGYPADSSPLSRRLKGGK